MLTRPSLQIRKGKSAYPKDKENGKGNKTEIIYTDNLIKKYLSENGPSKLGPILKFVNENLQRGQKKYTKTGFINHLNIMIEDGVISRTPYKQNHYLYSLTKKDGRDFLQKTEELQIAAMLLKTHFTEIKNTEEYFLKRAISRMGFYMIYSCIQALKNTSLEHPIEQNFLMLHKFARKINPSDEIINYIGDMAENFAGTSEDEMFTPSFQSKTRMEKILDFEKKLEKMYPNETKIFDYGKSDFARQIRKEQKDGQVSRIKFENWVKNLNNKMKKGTAKKLGENECPRCHYDGNGPVKTGPFKGDTIFRGYGVHGPDKSKWCDLCEYGMDGPLIYSE